MLHWVQISFMQANLSKFQFRLFGKNRDEYGLELAPDVTLVSCPSVHLLGVTLDCQNVSVLIMVFTVVGMREQGCGTRWIHILKTRGR